MLIVGRDEFWQLLYADDFDWCTSGPDLAVNVLVVIFFYAVVGVPFSWHKCGGGFAYDWIGYWQDYKSFEVGISEARAKWLCNWIDETLAQGCVLVRSMAEVLGRLGFAAGAIDYFRPFLGPFYAWCSSVPMGALLDVPIMLRILLKFFRRELECGGFLNKCVSQAPRGTTPDSFRADAMAEEGKAAMGGWCCADDPDPMKCRWFFLEIKREDAPWAFIHGEDQLFRFIATFELIATLACVHLFGNPDQLQQVILPGSTDNIGNSFILKKFMTTKFPLCCVLMQLAELLHSKGRKLSLVWLPRDDNDLADAISKEDFSSFDGKLRLQVSLHDFPLMLDLIQAGQDMYDTVRQRKMLKPPDDSTWARAPAKAKINTPWA